jgi:hypothetical protein
VDASRLHQSADLALLSPPPPPSRTLALLQAYGIPQNAPLVCVILRGGKDSAPIRASLLAATRTVCRHRGLTPIFLCFDSKRDHACTLAACEAEGAVPIFWQEPSDLPALFAACRAVVTMRLHGLIFATVAKVPAVGIPGDVRDGKIAAFAKSVGQEYLLPHELSAASIAEKLEFALDHGEKKRLFRNSVSEEQKKAEKDLANIFKMIYNINSNSF